MLPKAELQSQLDQHESLLKEETTKLENLRWVAELHRKITEDAEHRLNVRNDVVCALNYAIRYNNEKAEKLREISGATSFLAEQAVSSDSVYSHTMTYRLLQAPAPTEERGAGQNRRQTNDHFQPHPGLPRACATKFGPVDAKPCDLFVHDADELWRNGQWVEGKGRMIRRDAPKNEILMYVSGHAQLEHSTRMGCAVVTGPKSSADYATDGRLLTFCVETHGPTKELHSPSILRAELRAAIAALEHTDLADEGWSRITVATHSYDLVEGITKHIAGWQQQNWGVVTAGGPITSRDMWETLLSIINRYASRGVEVRFWRVPKDLNREARKEARKISERGHTRTEYNASSGTDYVSTAMAMLEAY